MPLLNRPVVSLPSRRLRIAPSLLSADFADLAGAIRAAEAGGADAFHLDVMDGHFVPNLSFGPALVKAVRSRTKLPLDVHLMIQDPGKYFEAFARAGGDTLVFHVESRADPATLIPKARELGVRVGAALKPDSPFDRVGRWLDRLDQVMVMSVYPGFSGQSFIPSVLPKVHEARRRLDEIGSMADVSIDGGVTVDTAGPAAREGATFFVCGNSVYAHGDVKENLHRLRRTIDEGARRAVP